LIVTLATTIVTLNVGFLPHRARRRSLRVGGEGSSGDRHRSRVDLVGDGGLAPLGDSGLEVAKVARRIFRWRSPRGTGSSLEPPVVIAVIAVARLVPAPGRGTRALTIPATAVVVVLQSLAPHRELILPIRLRDLRERALPSIAVVTVTLHGRRARGSSGGEGFGGGVMRSRSGEGETAEISEQRENPKEVDWSPTGYQRHLYMSAGPERPHPWS
jgi:hypothetical protein